MSNIDKLKSAAAKAVDNFDPNMFVEIRDVLALLDELEAKDRQIAELKLAIRLANDRYENRTPTQWAYDQACLAIEKHRTRADGAEKRIAEQREIMRQAASDISYAIYNLTGSDFSRLQPGVVETTDPTDTALIAERNLRAAAGKGVK
ncbi:TPA: hypothetical protein QIU50_002451 [Enterobacter hormaechei subsp. xiangfangensis]|nr:hypothetical protein [Enterobacter hormaechei subsp. xiangfangensis]